MDFALPMRYQVIKAMTKSISKNKEMLSILTAYRVYILKMDTMPW